jgi:putative hydrolase
MAILVDTHAHTVASNHAYSTVHDYFKQAKLKGLQIFSITDHRSRATNTGLAPCLAFW